MKKQKNLRLTSAYLVCPNCLEVLLREDIEGFGACPYCDYRFELNSDLEDFLLSPVIRQWVHQTRNQLNDETSL